MLFWVCCYCRAVPLEFVALKFQKSARHYTEAAADEVQLLTKVKDGMRHPCWREAAKSFSVSVLCLGFGFFYRGEPLLPQQRECNLPLQVR